jgi:PAS domain S-box-containing protein
LIVLEKGLAVAVSVPVFDIEGKVIGILGGAQRTPFLATFIKANTLNLEKSITLLDQEGNIIFSNTIPYEENITKSPEVRVLEKAVAGVITNMEIAGAKEKGSISYVSIAPVNGTGWSVIVGQEKNAILKSLYRDFILSAVAGFVIFLFLTVSLLYFRNEYKYRKTKELLQAEEKYRYIIENAVEGIFQTTPEGRYVSVNPALAHMFGYDSPEDMMSSVVDIGRQIYVNPEQRKEYLQLLDEKEVIKHYEARMYRKDGSIFWASINTRAVRDDAGNILYYEGFAIDITERKQAEQALRESEERFRHLFNNAQVGLFQSRLSDGKIVACNEYFAHRTGYESVEECCADYVAIERYVNPMERDRMLGILMTDGKVSDFEVQITKKDGTPVWANFSAKVYPNESSLEGAVIDITNRKRAEEALRETEELYSTVLQTSPDGITINDREGRITFMSERMLSLYGVIQPEDVIGHSPFEFIAPEDHARARLNIQNVFKNNYTSYNQYTLVKKDGTKFAGEINSSLLRDASGEPRGVISVIRDITERKRAEEELVNRENLLRKIFEILPVGLWIADKDGKMLSAKPMGSGTPRRTGGLRSIQGETTSIRRGNCAP